jgi:hypothetical protein
MEISEAWDQIKHGTISDSLKVVTDGTLAQALRIPIGMRYRDHYSDSMSAGYLRHHGSEEST